MASEDTSKDQQHEIPTADLFASAQVLAGAAQATLRHENVDKAKVAGAADELLNSASEYGKLEEKGFGQYVEKAETFIKQYKTPGEKPKEESEEAKSEKPEESGGGGVGDIMKMAQGFLK